jgi:hypothetical protein
MVYEAESHHFLGGGDGGDSDNDDDDNDDEVKCELVTNLPLHPPPHHIGVQGNPVQERMS